MKKFIISSIPYIINLFWVLLSIVLPFFSGKIIFSNYRFWYNDSYVLIIYVFSFVSCFLITMFKKYKFKHWIFSQFIIILILFIIFIITLKNGINKNIIHGHFNFLCSLCDFTQLGGIIALAVVNLLFQFIAFEFAILIKKLWNKVNN